MSSYPLKRYLDLLRLWYRLTDFDNNQVGPAVAGRLVGRPFTLATPTARFVAGTPRAPWAPSSYWHAVHGRSNAANLVGIGRVAVPRVPIATDTLI